MRKWVSPKKLVLIISILALILTCNISAFAATNLTTAQKQALYDSGFPTSRSAYIDAYYNDFIDNVDYYSYGSFSAMGAFQIFVSNLGNSTSASGLEDFSIVARGLYSEVSGHSGYYITELEHISDSVLNRVASGLSKWDTYQKAAQTEGMNAINPNSTGYWAGTPVKNPLYDCAVYQESRLGLIYAYCLAWDKVGVTYAPSYSRDSDLETGKYYFNESYVAGRHKAGNFYFY